MAETVQQYIERITSYVGENDALGLLDEAPGRLGALVEAASPAALAWTPPAGRWSIVQIAAHLADSEIVGAWRFRSVLAQDGVTLQAYDQNVWASGFGYEHVPVTESVALFGALRRATVALLRRVEPSRLEHAGMHAERGRESIGHLMRMYAGHDLNHLSQIERLLEDARTAGV